MAGDYVPIDHDFPEKPETLAIFESTGVEIGEIMLRLHKFWCTVDRQTDNGVLSGVGLRSLALLCGGDLAFWEAVQAVGWLDVRNGSVVMPGFKERLGGRRGCARQRLKWAQQKRKQRNKTSAIVRPMSTRTPGGHLGGQAPNQNENQNQNQNQNQEPLSEPEPKPSMVVSSIDSSTEAGPRRDETTGDALFWEAVRCRANAARDKLKLKARESADRSLLLKVCALTESQEIPEDWLVDATEALRLTEGKKDRPWAYFHQCLANKAGEAGMNFRRLLAGVTVPAELFERPARQPTSR